MSKFLLLIVHILVLISLVFFQSVNSQTRTVGLFYNDTSKVYKGYTLFAPKQNSMTFLINNEGRIVHQWTASKYPPGQSVYLLENGHLLRSCMTKGKLSSGGGEGGRVEEYDWNDSLVWQLDFSTDTYMQHHDIRRLPNGNIIMLVIEKKTYDECIAAGFDPSKFQPDIAQKGMMVPDYIVEIKPTYPVGGTVVWEWHTWDHLIQNFDKTKLNYGAPASHPELVDCDGDGRSLPSFWNHMNAIDYNPAFDQIAVSVRGNSEVWIIDHSTTTAEAKSHSGGKRGKGGDLLYRWGNPAAYGGGTKADQRYFEQHDVEWVLPGRPGAGNMTCFNNGLGRGGTVTYSSADEFTPAVDANGNYTLVAGSASPKDLSWTYKGSANDSLYSENISGAFRLPNGNTIICSGTIGKFIEVTSAGEIVWKYICPVQLSGIMKQGDTAAPDPARAGETLNSVFRIYKYAPDYEAFSGKVLTPGGYVETYPYSFYDLTVTSGSGTGYYKAGDKITVIAKAAPKGLTFDKWTGDVSYLNDQLNDTAIVTMPEKSISITATYKVTGSGSFILTVNSGKGSGIYKTGDTVTIIADDPPNGYTFDKWSGDISALTDINNDTTKAVISFSNVTVTAEYKQINIEKFTLTVNSGSGSGSYQKGDTVTIIAYNPPDGYVFDKWSGDTLYLIDINNDTTNLIMPDKAISIKAEYKLKTDVQEFCNQDIFISPNPAGNFLIIKCYSGVIQISDILGETVVNRNVCDFEKIDISMLKAGLYLIKVNYQNNIQLIKMIKF